MKKLISDTLSAFLILALSVWIPFGALGQSGEPRRIGGKVTDTAGDAVAGANVVVKGTLTGTITNAGGEFSLTARHGDMLTVSFLGYQTRELPVTEASQYDIVLEPDSEVIEDIVLIGYGTVKKSDLTGSVSSLKMNTIADIPARTIDGLLQGRVPGVQVLNTSQDPGAGSTIRIRGNSSLRGSNTPLVVVNGFPMGDAGDLSQINVSDIESVEVLKDASAAAIYGSRGANGVILITTKSAKEGVTTVSVKHQTVVSQLSDRLNIWYDPLLMAQVANEENVNAGLNPPYIGQTVNGVYYPSLLEIQNGEWSNTDWRKLTLRTPIVNNTTVSVNSAGERASFNLNVNYYDDQGIYKKDSYNKVNANMSVRYKLFKNLTSRLWILEKIVS